MPRPTALSAGRPASRQAWKFSLLPTAVGIVALATLAGGVATLIEHLRAERAQYVLAPAGMLLVACALVQLFIAQRTWRGRTPTRQELVAGGLRFSRHLLVGAAVFYLIALAVGPTAHIQYVFAAGVVAWYTLLVLPFAASPQVLEGWREWTQAKTPRNFGWLVVASLALVVTAECGLQLERALRAQGWFASPFLAATNPTGGSATWAANDPVHNTIAGWDSEPLRVAVLADRDAGLATDPTGSLTRVEQSLPGVEMLPLDLPKPWRDLPSDELALRLATTRADLVLIAVPVCLDVTRAQPAASWFDWRQFELGRRFAPPAAPTEESAPAVADQETQLSNLAPQLAACRTPIDPAIRNRWQQTFAAVDRLVNDCRRRDVAVALVLVPGEFQINALLRDALARRCGYAREELDLELPQRKVAGFADACRVPTVDLLPSLRLCRQSPYVRHASTWNETGEDAVASAIGGWLESRYGRHLAMAPQLTSAP